mmetsp:Transcript_4354/g.6104  ORF Transcript_4354/g.6104 Transcript_4354/m.6104 type:complete len:81 (-) Transcript_4354:40-282(-)
MWNFTRYISVHQLWLQLFRLVLSLSHVHKVIFSGRFLQVTPDEAKTIHDVFKTKKQEGNFSENLGKSQNGRPKDKNQRRD